MPNASELKSEYIIHFTAPYKDPRLEEVQLEDHLYLINITEDGVEELRNSMKRLLDAGVIESFSIALAEAVRITPIDLRRRLNYFKKHGQN